MRPPGRCLWQRWSWQQLLLVAAACLPLAQALVGVYEGDTRAELFVNSVYVPTSTDLPVLPMNSVRRFPSSSSAAKVIRTSSEFEAGDVIGLKVQTDLPEVVTWEDALGVRTDHPGIVAVIAAFADGTSTTAAWRCNENEPEGNIPWHSKFLDDGLWPQAIEQPPDCCPWRDTFGTWDHLAASWISPPRAPGNESGPRFFFCRYTVPHSNVSRLPERDILEASEEAPQVNITNMDLGSSLTRVSFNISRRGMVSCGLIDTRYRLRPPTHLELEAWGVTEGVAPTDLRWFDVTAGQGNCYPFTAIDFNITRENILAWYSVDIVEECQDRCLAAGDSCKLMTFFTSGRDLATGGNCRLAGDYDDNSTLPASELACFQHIALVPMPVTHQMTISGMLLPGTLYEAYCSARDNTTREHSTWAQVEATQLTARTEGCIDCGATGLPSHQVLGGWAADTSITVVVVADKTGRIFCAAVPLASENATAALFKEEIRAFNQFNILTLANTSVTVRIGDLTPSTLYEVACVAEGDGGAESSSGDVIASRRKWHTENFSPTIVSMSIEKQEVPGEQILRASTQVTAIGYIWCIVIDSMLASAAVPRAWQMREYGYRSKVEDLRGSSVSLYGGLNVSQTYDVHCTAMESDFSDEGGGTDFEAPYPVASIQSHTVREDQVDLVVRVDRGPSTIFCQAFQWAMRPTSRRPTPPDEGIMMGSPFRVDVEAATGGVNMLAIKPLATGSYHDVYCYAEDLTPPLQPGQEPPEVQRMPPTAIFRTRLKVQTLGPMFEPGGWHCVAGRPCNITEMSGVSLTATDKVVVRQYPCPGQCRCAGREDPDRKGAICSDVSHDRIVGLPSPGEDYLRDPRGHWCYVEPGSCHDEERSATFPDMLISYHVCTFNASIDREGAGPVGFANGGLAEQIAPNGTAFGWGSGPLVAAGAAYHLCWCNGTSSSCASELDFRITVGRLHVSGPTAEQAASTVTCVGGRVCNLTHFGTHAAIDGSRLVALPDTPLGCNWLRASPADPTAADGFPGNGVSEGAFATGQGYSWGELPVTGETGIYLLCWCGPAVATTNPPREGDPPYYHGGIGETCGNMRPDGGGPFLGMAGRILITGPSRLPTLSCGIGEECVIEGITGNGLTGGDTLAVLKECGVEPTPPEGWFRGLEELPAGKWVEGGWLQYGPALSQTTIDSIGVTATSNRAVWGFPNRGISQKDTRVGYFKWGGPLWAFAGEYTLCWCADFGDNCDGPTKFHVPLALIRVSGPQVFPSSSQIFQCIRGRGCEIHEYQGTMESGSQLMISSDVCTTAAPYGAPRNGISIPSEDGSSYFWGTEPIMLAPGLFRLCWCPNMIDCVEPASYTSFAGIIRVKGVSETPSTTYFCGLGVPCNISGFQGSGLNGMDKVMALAVCGHGEAPLGFSENGISIATSDDGTSYVLPPSTRAGTYRLCWCPGEGMCARGPDFQTDLGELIVGGPDASAVYICHEWASCTIPNLKGEALRDGDRLFVVTNGTDCSAAEGGQLPAVPGMPQGGLSSPAHRGGHYMSWGDGLVRAEPAVYDLCYCSSSATQFTDADGNLRQGCGPNSRYPIPGGSLRVGTAREYQYLTRPEDPEPRSFDSVRTFMLATILPILFLLVMAAGCRRLSAMRKMRQEKPDPEAPPLFRTRTSFAAAAQQKAQHMYHVKEVLETRLATGANQPGGRKQVVPVDEEIPSFVGYGKVKFTAETLAWKDKRKSALGLDQGDVTRNQSAGAISTLSSSPSARRVESRRGTNNGLSGLQRSATRGSLATLGSNAATVASSFRRSLSDVEELPPEPLDNLDRSQFGTLNRPQVLQLLDA